MNPRFDPARIRERLCAIRLNPVFRLIHSSYHDKPLEAVPATSRFSDPRDALRRTLCVRDRALRIL